MWLVKAVFSMSSGAVGTCQYPALQSSVEKTRASPSESMQSSIRGMGYVAVLGTTTLVRRPAEVTS